jgi:hypothetical protein
MNDPHRRDHDGIVLMSNLGFRLLFGQLYKLDAPESYPSNPTTTRPKYSKVLQVAKAPNVTGILQYYSPAERRISSGLGNADSF